MRFVSALLAAAAWLGLDATAQAIVRIDIDLSSQTMHVSSNEGDYDWAVSTGRPGFRTPSGHYRPQRMYVMTHSNEYENAPMPHAIFFSGGYAIHGTYATGALGQVASHGCVRLSPGHAAALYAMVEREGATIDIDGAAPGRDDVAADEAAPARRELAALDDEKPGFAPHKRHHSLSLRDWANTPLENQ